MRELNLTQLSLEAETDDISHVSTVFTSMLPREERLKVQKENRVKKQQPVAAIEEESADVRQLCNVNSTMAQR
jgi:hypothetical protein